MELNMKPSITPFCVMLGFVLLLIIRKLSYFFYSSLTVSINWLMLTAPGKRLSPSSNTM